MRTISSPIDAGYVEQAANGECITGLWVENKAEHIRGEVGKRRFL